MLNVHVVDYRRTKAYEILVKRYCQQNVEVPLENSVLISLLQHGLHTDRLWIDTGSTPRD